MSPYDVLGVADKATSAEIRQAYLDLAREHHPDRADEATADDAAHRMKEITAAFAILGHEASRAEYDRHQQFRAESGTPEPAWGFGHGGLSHEAADVDVADVFADGRQGATLPSWAALAPMSVMLLAALCFVTGMLLRWLPLLALGASFVVLGGMLFLAVPMFAMARAARHRD